VHAPSHPTSSATRGVDEIEEEPVRVLTTRMGSVAAIAAATVALSSVGAMGLTALQAPASDEELIDQLVEIERDLPELPPIEVVIDPEQTWGELVGDFTGAEVGLDVVEERARSLYIQAEESGGLVAEAVADAARAILVLRLGYQHLAEWETHDLAFPLDSFDDEGVATGADELYGDAEVGLSLVLDARERSLPAYALLRDSEAADDDERAILDARYQSGLLFQRTIAPDIHRVLSYDTTQVMVTVDRFTTSAPGVEPRARMMKVVCVDREAYATADVDGALASLVDEPADDCPAIENGNEVRVVTP